MRTTLLIVFFASLLGACNNDPITRIDLSGVWKFGIDSLDIGIADKWYEKTLHDNVNLPGSMATNGKGNDITVRTKWTGSIVDSSWYHAEKYARYRKPGNIKLPFWLQPVKYYAGTAWYQKVVEIPHSWSDRYIELFLERCHWETRVWVDNKEVGSQSSLATAHIYNLTDYLNPGTHRISIRVDNRIQKIDPGINSHSIADHTQSNWNGIVGNIELSAKPKIHLDDPFIFPDLERGTVTVKGSIFNLMNEERNASLSITTVLKSPGADPPRIRFEDDLQLREKMNDFVFEFHMGDELGIWDEFYPNLYVMHFQLKSEAGLDEKSIDFGIRQFEATDTGFLVNGRPAFLRGTLECAIFPKNGYPPTEINEWSRIIKICKAHGLNHMRFHSWCPPKSAFAAADELGFYLQVECSSWANQSTTLGDGNPVDQFIYDESERIVKMYGNHPSFCLMAYGNEPGGNQYSSFLTTFVKYWKEKDKRRLYTGAAGWPILDVNEYHNIPDPRIQAWGEELNSIINGQPPQTHFDWSKRISDFKVPVVSHEIGQWCVYPNYKEISKYDGVLKAKNFEIFRETLIENGLGHLADSFLLASGKLQTLCYKADVEAALRTPGFGGFQLLDLHDFPGQGTALVGVLDPFWDEKGYVTAEAFRRFCNSTVPLARMRKRTFYSDEAFVAKIEVAHFGENNVPETMPSWSIVDQNEDTLYSGVFDTLSVSLGNHIPVGDLDIELKEISKPSQLTLIINVSGYENEWDFWVYPKKQEHIDDIYVTQDLDRHAITLLKEGGSVLWSIPESVQSKSLNGDIGFSSIFWNTAWTRGQKPHSLGILCNPMHAAFNEFPTDYHSNWQWWDAMTYSNAIILSDFPEDLQPIVRVIDDWFQNRSQALIIEAKVGQGKLVISGIDFFENIENRPEGKQLLYSLKKYMKSETFNPQTELTIQEINNLFAI